MPQPETNLSKWKTWWWQDGHIVLTMLMHRQQSSAEGWPSSLPHEKNRRHVTFAALTFDVCTKTLFSSNESKWVIFPIVLWPHDRETLTEKRGLLSEVRPEALVLFWSFWLGFYYENSLHKVTTEICHSFSFLQDFWVGVRHDGPAFIHHVQFTAPNDLVEQMLYHRSCDLRCLNKLMLSISIKLDQTL